MKKLITTGFFALVIAGLTSCSVQKNSTASKVELPNKKEVLDVSRRANQYFMNKWPDTGKDIVGTFPSAGLLIDGNGLRINRRPPTEIRHGI